MLERTVTVHDSAQRIERSTRLRLIRAVCTAAGVRPDLSVEAAARQQPLSEPCSNPTPKSPPSNAQRAWALIECRCQDPTNLNLRPLKGVLTRFSPLCRHQWKQLHILSEHRSSANKRRHSRQTRNRPQRRESTMWQSMANWVTTRGDSGTCTLVRAQQCRPAPPKFAGLTTHASGRLETCWQSGLLGTDRGIARRVHAHAPSADDDIDAVRSKLVMQFCGRDIFQCIPPA